MSNRDKLITLIERSKGFSRTNDFRVELTLPPALDEYNQHLELMNLSCKSFDFPGFSIGTHDWMNLNSNRQTHASTLVVNNVDLMFYMPKSFITRSFFEDWRGKMIDKVNKRVGYYDDYVTNIHAYPMKRAQSTATEGDRSLIGVRFIEAFPVTVGSIQYDYESENQIAMLPVSFTYSDYELE